jgi:hypothetical protein
MDGGESFDGDIDGTSDLDIYNSDSVSSISGLRIISIRGALAFFSIGGWTVYLFADSLSPLVSIIIGLIAGSIAAVLLALAMKSILKLESSGNLDYRTAVGKIATVYIRVPKEANGKGKVIFNHQGKMVEVDAITNELEDILSKSEVKIINLIDESTLVVEKNLKKEN